MIEVAENSTLSGPGRCRRTYAGICPAGSQPAKGPLPTQQPLCRGTDICSRACVVSCSTSKLVRRPNLAAGAKRHRTMSASEEPRGLRSGSASSFRTSRRNLITLQTSPPVRTAVRLGRLKGRASRDRAADRSSLSGRRPRVLLVCRGEGASPGIAGTMSRRGRSRRPGARDP